METPEHELVRKASLNKNNLIALKALSVKVQAYELASKLRAIELKNFPESKEQKKAKFYANKLNLLFRMVELNIDPESCWVIFETIDKFNKLKGEFSIKESSKILAKRDELFK